MSKVGKCLSLHEGLTYSRQQQRTVGAGGSALAEGHGRDFIPSVLDTRTKSGICLEFSILRECFPLDQRAECSNITIGAFS